MRTFSSKINPLFLLAAIILLGLGLRLFAWQWREFYPLGGDEQEYLAVALTMLQERRYTELLFMRPPLYPIFLAASIYLVDSLVQNLRLVQALISTATIPLVYLLTRELVLYFQSTVHSSQFAGQRPNGPAIGYRAPLLAAFLTALSYTLAVNATELLSETLFLFSLTATLWLIMRAGRLGGWRRVALAGLALGAACLIRSVALPLLPLGAIWLFINAKRKGQNVNRQLRPAIIQFCIFTFAFCIIVLPWTARNYVTYGGVILIDTTGAENLWLDNDPAGREAVKAQLFAIGENRLARQQLASQRGMEVITADPTRFIAKMGNELKLLFALEYTDDMRARPAIWAPPTEVAARLLLGDGLWLLILLVGSYGLAYAALSGGTIGRAALLLFLPWCAYIALTSLIFHVELRYRLPVFPALLPFAALVLGGVVGTRRQGDKGQLIIKDSYTHRSPPPLVPLSWDVPRALIATLLPALFLLITLLHVNYPALAWQLGTKHIQLARAEGALARGDAETAQAAAQAALEADPGRALAHVALARTALLRNDRATAERELTIAIGNIPAHPHAHLLLGDLRRAEGDLEEAQTTLTTYETGSLQDLQTWLWERRITPIPAQLELGSGLDLGFVRGFHPVGAGEAGFRWTRERAAVAVNVPQGATALVITADARRPDGIAVPMQVWVNDRQAGEVLIATGSNEYRLALPPGVTGTQAIVELRSPTFTPRSFDPASPDGRQLGIAIRTIGVE